MPLECIPDILPGDPVSDLDDAAEIGDIQLTLVVFNVFFYDRTDLIRSQIHVFLL